MKRRRFWLTTIGALVGLLGLWTIYVQWMIYSVQHNQSAESADVAIVLGAALWNDVPSPALRERLEGAIQLYKQGIVSKIIVTGGLGNNGSTLTEAEGMKTYLLQQHLPESDIVTENEAKNTLQNLQYSLELMESNGWQHAIIVTHHYHGARALDMAKFLNYNDPRVYTVDSKVMYIPWHKARETLAYAKWTLQKWLLKLS